MLRCGLTALLVAVSKLTASPQLLQRAHILDTPDNITRWLAADMCTCVYFCVDMRRYV